VFVIPSGAQASPLLVFDRIFFVVFSFKRT